MSLKGSMLGPMLLLIYSTLVDLPAVTRYKSYLFADDTTLRLHNDTRQLKVKLNLKLENNRNWTNANKLSIHYVKT